MNYMILFALICLCVAIPLLIIIQLDQQTAIQNSVNQLNCDWLKGIIDMNEGLFFKDARYDKAVERYNNECKNNESNQSQSFSGVGRK